jgi:hypothetical protein
MALELTTTQSLEESAYTKVLFDKATTIGDKLTFVDNGVKIGAGVSYIKVSAIANPQSSVADSNAYIRICKNNSYQNTLTWIFGKITAEWGVVCLPVPPKLLKVEEGDIIQAYAYVVGSSGAIGLGNGAEMSMTVEVVK